MGVKCPPGCQCKRHTPEPRRKCEPGCQCNHHFIRKCEPNCRCGRHPQHRVNRVPSKYKRMFLTMTPHPVCSSCGGQVDVTLDSSDAESLVLRRVNGVREDITISNLTPMHRRCHSVMIRQLAR